MPALEKLRALILKRTKYGEADLILHLLTPQGARVSALAKGAIKSKRRFQGGVLEPTHFVELVLRPSPRADGLATVEEAKLLEGFDALRTSYDRLDTALALVEMVDKIAQVGDTGSSHLFDLLGNALRRLQVVESIETLRVQFSLKLLHQQGVLEVENWMTPFLKAPLLNAEMAPLEAATGPQQKWIMEQIEIYLKTAERF